MADTHDDEGRPLYSFGIINDAWKPWCVFLGNNRVEAFHTRMEAQDYIDAQPTPEPEDN